MNRKKYIAYYAGLSFCYYVFLLISIIKIYGLYFPENAIVNIDAMYFSISVAVGILLPDVLRESRKVRNMSLGLTGRLASEASAKICIFTIVLFLATTIILFKKII